MELTLWRWSLAVQVSSTLLVTAFFVALERSLPRGAITAWVRGWILNLSALCVAFGSWMFDPPPSVQPLALFLFLAPKTVGVLYLVQGAWSLVQPGKQFLGPAQVFVGGLLYPVFAGWVLTRFDLIGAGQQLFVALMFLPTGLALARTGDRALGWLAGAFTARGVLCLVESAAYAAQALPASHVPSGLRAKTGLFLAVHSAFDSGTEWLLALGFVLALSLRSQRALQASITGLHSAQEELRRLVDYDPLTALCNRRALPGILRDAQPGGAAVLFLDLDDFKRVNDQRGHDVGDRCLKRFAAALHESFRPGDAFVRYGGDEFVVVAAGMSRDLARERVEVLRSHLARPEGDLPVLQVSVGISELTPGGRPDDAIRAADDAMYAAKARAST